MFNAELNDTDIGDKRQIKHQDAFFFITHDECRHNPAGQERLKAAHLSLAL